jgi:cytochrome c oxidase subunit II
MKRHVLKKIAISSAAACAIFLVVGLAGKIAADSLRRTPQHQPTNSLCAASAGLRVYAVRNLQSGFDESDGPDRSSLGAPEKIIQITARRFEYSPSQITLKKDEPVVLEIKSEDVKHGFSLPDFSLRSDVPPGETARVRFTPDKTGEFTFVCDIFCGSGHEDMQGTVKVIE